MTEPRPNPGSERAQELGCICPILDNNHGRYAPWPPDGWWITSGCPIHNPKLQEDTNEPLLPSPLATLDKTP